MEECSILLFSLIHIYAIILALNSNRNSNNRFSKPKGMMVFFRLCLFSPLFFPLGYSSVFYYFFTNIYNKQVIK